MKKLLGIAAGVLVLLVAVLLLWEMVVLRSEAPSIEAVVYEYLDARKARDVERMYAQMLPVEEGGKDSEEALKHGVTAWGRIFFEEYKDVEIKVAWVIRGSTIVRGKFFYDNCDIWFDMSLVRTVKGWKIYDMVMLMHEDNLSCIEEK